MPSVGSYVGGDITAGVISSGMYATDKLTLFIDIGTNGEMVLGNKDWLLSCACSAGPAFEGGGVATACAPRPAPSKTCSSTMPPSSPRFAPSTTPRP